MDIKQLTGNTLRSDGTSSGVKPRSTSTDSGPITRQLEAAVGESVTLTATARTMASARETATTVPFDSEKVASIKAAISEGRYPIDNQRLADRLLNFEQLLA
jgi:negative regulator of flagellin synthesis FlgM